MFAAALVVLAVTGGGIAFALRPSPPRPFVAAARAGKLRVSIPRGFYRYALRDGIGYVGTQTPVSGWTFTDSPVADTRLGDWYANGPPTNKVGLSLNESFAIGPVDDKLHFPLILNQPWYEQRLANGAVGIRYGSIRFDNMDYEVAYWSGPDAPASDRAAILRALRSIRPAR